jgi:hypothetical protein
MPKTKEQYEACQEEIRAVCERHGIWIVGTCDNEGIYGEISMFDPLDSAGHYSSMKDEAFNWQIDHQGESR